MIVLPTEQPPIHSSKASSAPASPSTAVRLHRFSSSRQSHTCSLSSCCFLSHSYKCCLSIDKTCQNPLFCPPYVNSCALYHTPTNSEDSKTDLLKQELSKNGDNEPNSEIRASCCSNSVASISLDFERSDTRSKSIKESDIKSLVETIESIEEEEKIERDSSSEFGFALQSPQCDNLLLNPYQLNSEPHSDYISNCLTSKTFANSLSDLSDNYSTSSSCSADTLVFNPYPKSTVQKESVSVSCESDSLQSKTNACTKYCCQESSLNGRLSADFSDDDSEFEILESECQSSESDTESIVLEELEEIFKKFGFLAEKEDFRYSDFRSIGRYSTIHEESEDSESSNSSRISRNVVKTVYGMGQYYATAENPIEETKMDDSNTISPKLDSDIECNGGIHYDNVDFDDFASGKADESIEYRSDQFSASPQSSRTSTANSSWRTSQASTNTIESSSTAPDSDDTLGNDMSELSSINSRLSTINDPSDPCFGTLDRKIKAAKVLDRDEISRLVDVPELERESGKQDIDASNEGTNPINLSPNTRKKQALTLKEALQDLESIELAAKTMLEQKTLATNGDKSGSVTPTPESIQEPYSSPLPSVSSSSEKAVNLFSLHDSKNEPKVVEFIEKSDVDIKPHSWVESSTVVQIVGENEKKAGQHLKSAPSPPPRRKYDKSKKIKDTDICEGISEEKPPLPPSISPVPKPEVKKRWWSRTKETPLFISRESYNEEQVAKELKKLRQSYKEKDLNDFLDALEHTQIPPDVDEEFFEQLLTDLKEDLKISPSKSLESLNEIKEAPLPASINHEDKEVIKEHDTPKSRPRSSSTSKKFEKVKERVKELLKKRKRARDSNNQLQGKQPPIESIPKSESSLGRSTTPLSRSETPDDHRGSGTITPDSIRSDDTKKSFSLSGFFKKSSPKFLRKKYNENKNRKSASESEADDADHRHKSVHESDEKNTKRKSTGSEGQEIKKGVRFSEEVQDISSHQNKNRQKEYLASCKAPQVVEVTPQTQDIHVVKELEPSHKTDTALNSSSLPTEETEEESKVIVIPLTVENLNRAESILPKLPERIKPPRRKKKMLIPTTVDKISNDDVRSSVASDQSLETYSEELSGAGHVEDNVSTVPIEKQAPAQEVDGSETEVLKSKSLDDKVESNEHILETEKSEELASLVSEQPHEVISDYASPLPPSLHDEGSIISVPSNDDQPDITVISPNVDQNDQLEEKESILYGEHEKDHIDLSDANSINTYSDITETNSTKEPSPVPLPDITEDMLIYEDKNATNDETSATSDDFSPKETIENETENNLPAKPNSNNDDKEADETKITGEENKIKVSETGYQLIETELSSPTPYDKKNDERPHALFKEAAEVSHALINIVPKQDFSQRKTDIRDQPERQEMHSLESLAEEMDKIASEMTTEGEISMLPQQEASDSINLFLNDSLVSQREEENTSTPTSSTIEHDRSVHSMSQSNIISRIQVNKVQHEFNNDAVKDFANTLQVSTAPVECIEPVCIKKQVKHRQPTPEIVNTSKANKSFFPPDHTDSVSVTPITKTSSSNVTPANWIKTSINPIPVPPRQFLDKMPMKVMTELKSILVENENSPILRKAPEPTPRWDSSKKFNELASKFSTLVSTGSTSQEQATVDSGRSTTVASSSLSSQPALNSLIFESDSTINSSAVHPANSSVKNILTTSLNLNVEAAIKNKENVFNPSEDFERTLLTSKTQPTEISKVDTNHETEKSIDRESNVSLPLTSILDQSSGPDRTFKLRATVYPRFESSSDWDSQKIAPPVPRRQKVSSLSAADGYESDPGGLSFQSEEKYKFKRFSMFVQSNSSKIKLENNSDSVVSFKKASNSITNRLLSSLPPRPPPPQSSALRPTLAFMAARDSSPPPIPSRKSISFVSSKDSSPSSKADSYKAEDSSTTLSNPDVVIKSDVTNALTISDVNSVAEKLVGGDSGSVSSVVGGGEAAGHLPKVSARATSKDSQCFSTPISNSNLIARRSVNFCDSNSNNDSLIGELCDDYDSDRSKFVRKTPSDSVNVSNLNKQQGHRIKESDHSGSENHTAQCLDKIILRNNKSRSGTFADRLKRTSQLLDELDKMEVLSPATFSNHLSDSRPISINHSPSPPPRPRTPINERDPEQVRAERRYESYFQGMPRASHKPSDIEIELEPTLEQINATKRYSNYFLGPPRAKTPIDYERDGPDEEQIAAWKRYQQYFKKGPPRPRPLSESDVFEVKHPDKEQVEAEKRYRSYFMSGPRRVVRSSTPEIDSSHLSDKEKAEAEERYKSYFRSGPPRQIRSSTPETDSTRLSNKEIFEAEERYRSYFQKGPRRPPRPPTPENEVPSKPDRAQKAAEKRYESYFKIGPPRSKSQPYTDFGLEKEKQEEAEKRYLGYFKGGPKPRCSSVVDQERTPSPDEQQIEATKRYQKYFMGVPRAVHREGEDDNTRAKITKEMLEAEERLNKYFLHPVPCGEPRLVIDPPLDPAEAKRRQLLAEYWSALQERNKRRSLKVVKVSKAKKEVKRESTPPTQRELVVDEFLQRVKERKKERNLHYGDTDSEDEGQQEEDGTMGGKEKIKGKKEDLPENLKLEGGGTLAQRVASDLGNFIGEEGECLKSKPRMGSQVTNPWLLELLLVQLNGK